MKKVKILLIIVFAFAHYSSAYANWMPDENLRKAIREKIGLPEEVALEKRHLQILTYLGAHNKGITDIQGLAHATNLRELHISQNPISDISELADLTNLRELHFWHFPAHASNLDLSPLANLVNLEVLSLQGNGITDISPLSGLKHLWSLHIMDNHIEDFSPLAGLTNLRELWITHNWARDFSMLAHLNLTTFEHDEFCLFQPLGTPIEKRIQMRSLPSIFQAWDHIIGREDIPAIALHDLYWSASHSLDFWLDWHLSEAAPTYGLSTVLSRSHINKAKEAHQGVTVTNPNMILLHGVNLHYHHSSEAFPPDSEFWLRDESGQIAKRGSLYLMDLRNPELQQLLIDRIGAIAECGLFDGVFLDDFFQQGTGYYGDVSIETTDEEIIAAHAKVLNGVRERVRDDFLILVNANRTKPTEYVEYINGVFMETGHDPNGSYTRKGLIEIEDTLLWAERRLRAPQINALEGEGVGTSPPDSSENKRWMRVFTTMSLTLSDGYVLYTDGTRFVDPKAPHHAHIWYNFWDADLGQPIGEKAKRYENRQGRGIEGLFIREFTNGWAVYNRSGKARMIQLPEKVDGWASGVKNKRWHTIPDLDGEIYLKVVVKKNDSIPADVNGDGVVNILDLVATANAFGAESPDLNGDGVVNVLDLVMVANAF